MRMRKLSTVIAILTVFAAGTARAEQPSSGDFTLFFTNAFSSSSPSYNVGMFVTPDIMPYAGIRVFREGNTSISVNGGSRFYMLPGSSGNLRTFADAEITVFSNGIDTLGLGGYIGAEYHVARQASIAARVGFMIQDRDPGNTRYDLGAADVILSFYF